jgi:hypothetical protein
LALAIEQTKINNTLQFLNERYPKEGNDHWHLNYQNYYFYNNVELATTINKLIKECMSTFAKDAFRFNFTRAAGTDHTDANSKIYR